MVRGVGEARVTTARGEDTTPAEGASERLRGGPKGQLWLPHKIGRGLIWIYGEVEQMIEQI